MKRALVSLSLAAVSFAAIADTFRLGSNDVPAGGNIGQTFAYDNFGCTGKNISPALFWENPPEGTRSFAITVHDPDAETGGAGFWHWMVVNIPAATRSLSRGAGNGDGTGLPGGAVQINTDFGVPGWGGPCPPIGEKPHRYNFTVYALKVDKLELPPNATASLAGFIINANALNKSTFTGMYGR